MSTGARGGDLGEGNEEMQDHVEMEEDSTSNVPMLAASGTFIAGTADGTVTEARHQAKRQRAAVNVSEDLLNRQIQDYGLVSPERAKNVVWCFFRNTGPRSSRIKMTILNCHNKPSARSVWRTSRDVWSAQSNWAKTIHRLR